MAITRPNRSGVLTSPTYRWHTLHVSVSHHGLVQPVRTAWRLSNTLDADFCVEALEEALSKGRPDVFNTDQGSQFTGKAFTGLLEKHGIKISNDSKGSYRDNLFIERLWRTVKYEEVYLKAYQNGKMPE